MPRSKTDLSLDAWPVNAGTMVEAFETRRTIPAATVVVFRRGRSGSAPELLMVQRADTMRAFGGAAVFPGGRIDPQDRALASQSMPNGLPEVDAARIAAIRETLEETGLAIAMGAMTAQQAADARALLLAEHDLAPVIDRFGRDLRLETLIPFAHWCPDRDGAFDTRFFLYDLGSGAVDLTVDATENTRLFWISAANALAMANAGEISIIFPTRRNLERLALFGSFDEARLHAERTPVDRIVPRREEREGVVHLVIPEGLGYPITSQMLSEVRRA